MFSKRLVVVASICASLMSTSCSKDAATDPLAYAPANTPFLLANLEPMPAAAMDTWLKNAEQMMPIYDRMLDAAAADMAKDKPEELATRVIKAMRDEFRGKFNRAGLESMGISMSSRVAVYGIGLIPVMRIELGNPDAFRALIGRVEAKVGEKLATGTVGKQAYWSAGPAKDKLQLIIAIQDKYLVMSFAPKAADSAVLEQLLGLTMPDESVLDAKLLSKFNDERDYVGYGSGYIDSSKLFAVLFGERTPAEKAFLDALGQKNPMADVSPVCKAEYQSIAVQVPRLSFGYTTLDAHTMNLRYVLETTPQVGAELAKLAVTVPGLDGHGEGLFDFGFGIDLNALVAWVNAKSSAVAAAPYQCESLKSLNEGFASARTNMSNPGVFMAAAAFKGVFASLSKLELPEGLPPVVEGRIAIASDNPQSLLSMAAGFAPPLAGLTLAPNQAPVALALDSLPPGTPPTYIALADKALGLAIGSGQDAGLQEFLATKSDQPSPLLHYGVNGAGMATFFDMMVKRSEAELGAAEAMAAQSSDEDSTSDEADEEEGDEAASAQAAEALAQQRIALDSMKAMQQIYTQMIERADFAVRATPRGIELEYALRLK